MSSPSRLSWEKARVRREMKHRWELLCAGRGDLEFLRERLQDNLRWWLAAHPGIWGSFRPLPREADALCGDIPGVQWVYPRIQEGGLVFAPEDPALGNERWTLHRLGMEEPSGKAPVVELTRLTGLLVPGLAFDRRGGRLGRGAGFYDRTLLGHRRPFRGLKVGVGYGFQMMKALPLEPHDVRMNLIITDQTVIECGGERWNW